MLNKFLFVTFCAFTPFFGLVSASTPQQEHLQVGRYQMVGVVTSTNTQLYLLDTATGHVWKSKRENNWLDHDVWELQIATPPALNR